jgi:hypothetical protein
LRFFEERDGTSLYDVPQRAAPDEICNEVASTSGIQWIPRLLPTKKSSDICLASGSVVHITMELCEGREGQQVSLQYSIGAHLWTMFPRISGSGVDTVSVGDDSV